MSERSGTSTRRPIAGKILVTGAAGYMASMLLPHFAQRYELRLVDVAEIVESHGVTDTHVTFAVPSRKSP